MKNKIKKIVSKLNNHISIKSCFNNTTDVVYYAGKACYNGNTDKSDYQDMTKFIDQRIKVGHESIIEHTNFICSMIISSKYYEDLIEVLSCCRYLNTKTKVINDKNKTKILVNIAGSIRGWKHIYRTIVNTSNSILRHITDQIYQNISKEYFTDFINDGIFDASNFCVIDEKEQTKYNRSSLDFCIPNDLKNKIQLIHIDCIEDFKDKIDIIDDEYWFKDLLTITVKFTGLARYSTHQLVRHRNGITQESQRYVDYSEYPVNNPVQYNPDYDKDKKYHIPPSNLVTFKDGITADELCLALQPLYGYLKNQGMRPEEARGYAPFATSSGSLYMTFTYSTLAKFLELRMDKTAQGEIRHWAEILHEYIQNIPEIKDMFDDEEGNLHNRLIQPMYKVLDDYNDAFYKDIDELIM